MAELSFPPVDVKALNLAKTFKGHLMSVSSLAMHPTKPIVVRNLLFTFSLSYQLLRRPGLKASDSATAVP